MGMVVADALAIVVGILLGKKLPEKLIKWTSATIFIGFGAFALIGLFWK
ncbi:MAG: TMEM165/GDT1 family protein [Thermincolia bacterium]